MIHSLLRDSCGDPVIPHFPLGEGLPIPRGLGKFPREYTYINIYKHIYLKLTCTNLVHPLNWAI